MDITSLDQTHGPFFDIPEEEYYGEDEDEDYFNPEDVVFLVTHRLLLFSQTLPIDNLILPNFVLPTEALQTFLPTQVLDLLDVRTLTFSSERDLGVPPWFSTIVRCAPAFIQGWDDFERLVMESASIDFQYHDDEGPAEESLPLVWAKAQSSQEEKRRFEIVFNLASATSSFEDIVEGYPSPKPKIYFLLSNGGMTKRLVELTDLRVVVKVKKIDETKATALIQGLEEWMKPLVVVEGV